MGIKSYSIVGWQDECARYCNDCAEEMGITNDKSRDEMTESDGNPIFADSEFDYQPHCHDCGAELPYVTVLQYE